MLYCSTIYVIWFINNGGKMFGWIKFFELMKARSAAVSTTVKEDLQFREMKTEYANYSNRWRHRKQNLDQIHNSIPRDTYAVTDLCINISEVSRQLLIQVFGHILNSHRIKARIHLRLRSFSWKMARRKVGVVGYGHLGKNAIVRS